MARPSGNATGIANLSPLLVAKQIEILGEIVPHMRMVAMLNDSSRHNMPGYEDAARRAARADEVIE